MSKPKLLDVKNLKKFFPVKKSFLSKSNQQIKAVDGVDISVDYNEVVGLVGESGCGKSTLGKTVLRLIEPTEGDIFLEGKQISKLSLKELRPLRKKVQMIFQDPVSSLNPRMTIFQIVEEPLKIHTKLSTTQRKEEVFALLKRVGISESAYSRYPHQFSGGQCQRIAIARALTLKPKLIIADEPVSALDVSIQAQILNLMSELKEETGVSYLFISHDLSVINHLADRVVVMYLGEVVEEGTAEDVVESPLHPYTQALVAVIPSPKIDEQKEIVVLEGSVPSPMNPPSGCRFHTRCPKAELRCQNVAPKLREFGARKVRCHFV